MQYIGISITLFGLLINIYNLMVGLKQINYDGEIETMKINIKYHGVP